MSSTVQKLTEQGHLRPPSWLSGNVRYETITGSTAYGVANDGSDIDIVGFCVPPKDLVFPHLAGVIPGFGRQKKNFICFQDHHVKVEKREYDFNVYNIVHYFALCMENNPDKLDSLFTPRECIVHSSKISEMVRDKRRMFLHKGAWYKFRGYAYSQLHKLDNKNKSGKRSETIDKHGYDVKFAYHVVRLLGEIEQILSEGDIDLRRNSEHLKAIRRGDVSEVDIRKWAAEKEHSLERLYETSKLPYGPDEPSNSCCLTASKNTSDRWRAASSPTSNPSRRFDRWPRSSTGIEDLSHEPNQ